MTQAPDVPGLDRLRAEKDVYAQGEERPLGSYVGLMSVYGAAVGTAAVAAAALGKRPPEQVSPWDVALISVATHKLSRLISKDSVTSPIRAPFTHYRGVSGPAELQEEVRGSGGRKAVGELITCPFCLGLWIASGFVGGLVFAPGVTRLATAALTSLAASDFLHFGYARLSNTD
jgi:hypothetical protein